MSNIFLEDTGSDVIDLKDAAYVLTDPVRNAVNAALATGRPLLVRGEPGVGKSDLARAAAKALGRVYLRYTMTIQTEPNDLLWNFDAVRRLAEAQVEGAIANAETKNNAEAARKRIGDKLAVKRFLKPGPLWWAFEWDSAHERASEAGGMRTPDDGEDPERGCVLLIDEIDKAETDVPNGLLEAFGSDQFEPPDFGRVIRAGDPRPLIIITSNDERTLPDAFVRRCLGLVLTFPEDIEELIRRGREHMTDRGAKWQLVDETILRDAAEQLLDDRRKAQEMGVRPIPGQAEYIDLLRGLHRRFPGDKKQQEKWLGELRKYTFQKQFS